tara:strand:+ start:102 stop:365 length:264 start_codon:yes stop_codon:yes gene_type:complete
MRKKMNINNMKPRPLLKLVSQFGSIMIKMPKDDTSKEYLAKLKAVKYMSGQYKNNMAVEFRIERHDFLVTPNEISRWLKIELKNGEK